MTCTHEHYVDVAPGVRECVDCGARETTREPVETTAYWLQRPHRYVHLLSGEIVEDHTE